jgi:RNA polymerase sigma-70 factor (ECF subfamily)
MSSMFCSQTVDGTDEARATRRAACRAEALVDVHLVRRFNGGDETAFNEIVRRHRHRVFGAVSGCLRNRADVEEVVDDAFIRAYRGLRNFRGESSLATWLHHIAINRARNRYWYLLRRRLLAPSRDVPGSEKANETLIDFIAAGSPDPAQAMDQEEFAAIVIACLNRLPPRQRDILRLRALLDASYQRIAIELGINEGTVKSRIARAREHLRTEVNAIVSEAPWRTTMSF